jgi:DNA-binding transcriptional ArsR family regulator
VEWTRRAHGRTGLTPFIRTLDDMIESVSKSAPPLAPLFRSDQQMHILAELFTTSEAEVPVGELARRARVAQATVSREVARLAEHGLVVCRRLGRNTLVKANWSLPWAKELQSILVQTVGVLGRLADALGGVPGVGEAYVFGSWAARYCGEPGPSPRDVDVVVVGDAELRSVRRASRPIEEELRVEINPVVVEPGEWSNTDPSPFIAQIRAQPLVPIPIERQ